MMKFVGMVILLGAVFWCGYYVGRQPPEDVKQTLHNFSEEVVEKALGVKQEDLRLREEFLEAKSRMLQSKSHLLDGDYQPAARELKEALRHLTNAVNSDQEQSGNSVLERLMAKVKTLQESLSSGEDVSQETLDNTQKELDRLMTEWSR